MPPWPEIYVGDDARRHDLVEAEAEYHRLCAVYPMLDYDVTYVPRLPVAERADFVLATLGLKASG